MNFIKRLTLLGLLVSGPPFVDGADSADSAGATLEFSSGIQQVALVELYTSEGCSSCPPADKWLSKLETDPGLWKTFTPIAFHVDYWDYIGWDDKFAQPEFGDRQRRYAAEGGVGTVYTPGLFRNGQAWRGWRTSNTVTSDAPAVGNLSITVKHGGVDARFDALAFDSADLVLNVAVLGMNLETRIRAGENAGKTLHHDFVVVGLSSVALEYSNGKYIAAIELPDAKLQTSDRAIVAWISNAQRQAPIQSTGGILPRS